MNTSSLTPALSHGEREQIGELGVYPDT